MAELDFSDRVAIVTGAGNGLGRAYALWLSARGAKVVVNNRRHADQPWSAQAVVREIEAAGGIAIAEPSDATATDSGEAMVRAALDSFGRIDIVIANAGGNTPQLLADQSLDDLRDNAELNFFGAIKPVLAALPHFNAQNYGRIVFTASGAALFGCKTLSAYAAAKMAQIGLSRSLGIETSRTGIRVNVISPYAHTKMAMTKLPDWLEALLSPDKVAPVVGWLAHESCPVNGQIFSAGSGRIRRVALVEGPVIDLEGGSPGDKLDQLLDLSQMVESRDMYQSALDLTPELAKAGFETSAG